MGIRPVKKMGRWLRWALVSPDEVAPSRMVGVSASVNCTIKSRSSLPAPAHSGRPRKRAVKRLWWLGLPLTSSFLLEYSSE